MDRTVLSMILSDAWARRVKRRLERAGFKVTLVDPALAMRRKHAARRRDQRLLAEGKATADQLQTRNSLFRGGAKQFRILDYGSLNQP